MRARPNAEGPFTPPPARGVDLARDLFEQLAWLLCPGSMNPAIDDGRRSLSTGRRRRKERRRSARALDVALWDHMDRETKN